MLRPVIVGPDHASVQHAGHADVVDIGELAGHLGGDVDARDRLADHLVAGGFLEFDLGIDLELDAVADQFAVAQCALAIDFSLAPRHPQRQGRPPERRVAVKRAPPVRGAHLPPHAGVPSRPGRS